MRAPIQELGSGAPEESRSVVWGTNHVDGTGETLGLDCDVGRGGVAGPGGTNWIGISGAQEVEGRRFFAMVGGSIGLVCDELIHEIS